jgi:hypothetical protein
LGARKEFSLDQNVSLNAALGVIQRLNMAELSSLTAYRVQRWITLLAGYVP